jgi:carotenoid 1,2-hydratase
MDNRLEDLPVSRYGPHFAVPVADRGYVWWYVDAWSDCGRYGLTLIAMLGCVFSPWYAWARRAGRNDPLQHSALNLALYGECGHRWALTERSARAVQRSRERLRIGPSALHWTGHSLIIDIDERTAPLPRALRGRLHITPSSLADHRYNMDRASRHHWMPWATSARIEAEFSAPALHWQGQAYLDANQGIAPLEDDFTGWNWSRAAHETGTTVFYDTRDREDRQAVELALEFDRQGVVKEIVAPPLQKLPRTGWLLEPLARCDAHAKPTRIASLEDGPFYARARVSSLIHGRRLEAFHETVSLRRFASRWVQCLLPVKLPRRS